MPHYHFHLLTRTGRIVDPEGTELPDGTAAREHGAAVARELMRNSPPGMRSWRLDVCDADHRLQASLLLAEFDARLEQLEPVLRETVVDTCMQSASMREAIDDLKRTILQVKGTIARSKRQPYLAAIEGVQL